MTSGVIKYTIFNIEESCGRKNSVYADHCVYLKPADLDLNRV